MHDRSGGAAIACVPARFVGPPGNANGGIATGTLVCPALAAAANDGLARPYASRVTARLRRGLPVERALTVEVGRAAGVFDVSVGDADGAVVTGVVAVVDAARARPGDVVGEANADRLGDLARLAQVDPPERPPFFVETGDHPIPGCFSCGPENAEGLHIYPRVVDDGVVCAPWQPALEYDDGGGALAQLVMASALDCSSGICLPVQMQRELLDEDRFFLLGSLDVRYLRIPPVAGVYRVAAMMLERDGRKFFGFSALFDAAGTAYATAEATWIVAGITRTEAWGARA